MKNILLLLILLSGITCKAQTTISLEQAYQYKQTPDGIPETVTYVQDVNNRLDKYVGIWKGSVDGNNYEFHFTKKTHWGGPDIYWDKLIGRFLVKDNAGNILYNSLNRPDDQTFFKGDTFQKRTYMMSFVGNSGCNEFGTVFMEVKKYDANKMKLFLSPDQDIINLSKCPDPANFKFILPTVNEVVLTKQ